MGFGTLELNRNIKRGLRIRNAGKFLYDMATSSIEWTEVTWNPTTGCDKVSSGCKNCYAETMSSRLLAMGADKYKNGFALTEHFESLNEPYKWKKPRVVFVNSMSDLFHESVSDEFILPVFEVMRNTNHTFQVLTKRAERLLHFDQFILKGDWPENVWMGVSVENETVLERVQFSTNQCQNKILILRTVNWSVR